VKHTTKHFFVKKKIDGRVIPQLWVQVIQMCPYTPLWKRGARGDFISIILKSPFIPLCQRGIKNPETEGLHGRNLNLTLSKEAKND
jgi:hypothetical protein